MISKENSKDIYKKLKEKSDSLAEIFRKYATNYATYHMDFSKGFNKTPPTAEKRYTRPALGTHSEGYVDSYKAALASGTKEQIVILAETLFNMENKWESNYGGAAWAKIARAWLELDNAKDLSDMQVWIDHVYDLQHNTNTVFNKLTSYLKDGSYEWLLQALNHKAKIKSPYELFDKISWDMKHLAGFAIKAKYGTTLEDFIKKSNPSPSPTGGGLHNWEIGPKKSKINSHKLFKPGVESTIVDETGHVVPVNLEHLNWDAFNTLTHYSHSPLAPSDITEALTQLVVLLFKQYGSNSYDIRQFIFDKIKLPNIASPFYDYASNAVENFSKSLNKQIFRDIAEISSYGRTHNEIYALPPEDRIATITKFFKCSKKYAQQVVSQIGIMLKTIVSENPPAVESHQVGDDLILVVPKNLHAFNNFPHTIQLNLDKHTLDTIKLLGKDKKIEIIKELRAKFGISLLSAKHIAEHIIEKYMQGPQTTAAKEMPPKESHLSLEGENKKTFFIPTSEMKAHIALINPFGTSTEQTIIAILRNLYVKYGCTFEQGQKYLLKIAQQEIHDDHIIWRIQHAKPENLNQAINDHIKQVVNSRYDDMEKFLDQHKQLKSKSELFADHFKISNKFSEKLISLIEKLKPLILPESGGGNNIKHSSELSKISFSIPANMHKLPVNKPIKLTFDKPYVAKIQKLMQQGRTIESIKDLRSNSPYANLGLGLKFCKDLVEYIKEMKPVESLSTTSVPVSHSQTSVPVSHSQIKHSDSTNFATFTFAKSPQIPIKISNKDLNARGTLSLWPHLNT